jgi:hypothetical protein
MAAFLIICKFEKKLFVFLMEKQNGFGKIELDAFMQTNNNSNE